MGRAYADLSMIGVPNASPLSRHALACLDLQTAGEATVLILNVSPSYLDEHGVPMRGSFGVDRTQRESLRT